MKAIIALLFLIALQALPTHARQVKVPLTLEHAFIQRLLLERMFSGPDQSAQVWRDEMGCNYLTLSSPEVDGREGRLRILTRGVAQVGTPLGKRCVVVLSWRGFLEVFEEPVLEPGIALIRFRVVDSNIYDEKHEKRLFTGKLWDWVKGYAHPRFEGVAVDLQDAVDELRAFLPLILPSEDAERTERLLASLVLSAATASERGLVSMIRFDVTDITPIAQPTPEPTLTPEEIERWEAARQQWDAFLTFVVKQAGRDTGLVDLRVALREVLLEARHDLLEALAPSYPGASDPVPALFVKTWHRLAPVARQLSTGLPGEAALRYLSFVAAGDALVALDELGPATGLDISADGLRRLARMVAPESVEDPLFYSVDVDPELRALFGFGPPLPAPIVNPDVATTWSRWLWAVARAATEPPPEVLQQLNRWAPSSRDFDKYLPLVHQLLDHTAHRVAEDESLDRRFRELYRWSVLATAWQESCWRQFVKVRGQLRPLQSAVGSVGLMQVNQHVWRGFYDVQGLRTDVAYNTSAGSEILLHYLVDYAIAKGEHTKTGNVDNLSRASYAAYNAGPGQLARYRNPKAVARAKRVDEAFWTKYKTIKSGKELAVAACFGGGRK